MAPKRKRAPTVSKEAEPSAQASRDTANEAIDDAHTADVPEDKKAADPPAKRTRSSTAGSSKKVEVESTAPAAANGHTIHESGAQGEADSMRMEPPPKAGIIDPAGGYKTNAPPKGRPVRIYADGVFDLFHLGHMRQLQQAKTAFPDTWLIVGVTGDAETHKRKGLTVLSGKERAESVRHCRWVDEVVEDCPWIIDVDFIEKHKIDFVAHDDIPYGASEGDDIYAAIKKRGQFLVTQRTEGVSTTGIITKIVRDYEQYIARQLKRGTSRQELNISWLKKNEMDIKRHVNELRDNIRQNWTSTGKELSKELRQFWPTSRQNSPAPSLRNGTPSRAGDAGGGLKSPLLDRLNPIDTSRGNASPSRAGRNADFAAGYAMGLIGGVKGWMTGSHRRHLSDSRAESPSGSDGDSPGKSPLVDDDERGRTRTKEQVDAADAQLSEEMGEKS
ncbi:Nucleotidylyl transferase [Polychaeton citri CBS 116435]|uniref:choline-phosphate cytidylyltransferase n=1 Tax=Polychaeton citri CBS 116435 TaxID=1314669 RepID=A0A9P4UML5_9PEZI|nr:Nucleotidylyl transferase [Polychaeton citri CBS 116435]